MRRIRLLIPDDAGGGGGESEVTEQQTDENNEGQSVPSASSGQALAHAVGRYRELVASGPGLVSEMVQGSTIEQVDASAEIARQAYATISRRIVEQHETHVPIGNPARSSADMAVTNLKPEAKIALGLSKSKV